MKLRKVTAVRLRARSMWDTHQFPLKEVTYLAVLEEERSELGALLLLLRQDGSLVDEVWYASEPEAIRAGDAAFILTPEKWAVLPDTTHVPQDLPPGLR